jgi:LCP family protein required for cell wall assembly
LSEVSTGRHRGETGSRHRVARAVGYLILTVTLGMGLFVTYTYRTLGEGLTVIDPEKQLRNRPDKADVAGEPLNVLIMGSDSRDGAGNNIDGLSGGGQRSDTTMLVHLSGDRKNAYGVSLPRDAMVERPDCVDEDGDTIPGTAPGQLEMWNTAFALGGPVCTVQQTEQLTGVRIDHFVVVDFNGFKDMVDAIDGVEICIPEDVDDETGNIHLDAGTREVDGKEALDYVRVRHGISQNGDIGRMKRQQVFIAAMANKVMSAETLWRPDRLVGFLRAATRSLTLDKGLGTVNKIRNLVTKFQDIGLDDIKFITVPWDFWPEDPNRLIWTDDADALWNKMKFDKPLSRQLSTEAVSAAQRPGGTEEPAEDPSTGPSDGPSDEPSDQPSEAPTRSAEEIAAENGLCT